MLRHYHARSGRSCAVAAHLAGISSSYLHDLLTGRRWRISGFILRTLCEDAWQVSEAEGKELLWLRHDANEGICHRVYLTKELIWRLAAHSDLQMVANHLGLDYSYVVQVMSGKRRPAIHIVMSLYAYVGLDTAQAARLYASEVHRTVIDERKSTTRNDETHCISK